MNARTRIFKRSSLLILAFALLPTSAFGAAQLVVKGLRNQSGSVAVSIFSEHERKGFPGHAQTAAQTFYVKIGERDDVIIPLDTLPQGRYAIAVLHDEDENHKLRSFLGIPREGFGFSNNPLVVFGPPSIKDAVVQIDDTSIITVQMKHFL